LAIAGQSTATFAAFTLKADIILGSGAFELNGHFTLGAGSNGSNPVTEDVVLDVGTFSTMIAAGSFKYHRATRGQPVRLTFEGVIEGVALEVKITDLGGGTFRLQAEGQGANLTGTENPVAVGFTIGDDGGSTTVTADFQ
jgi:hypothetical protein